MFGFALCAVFFLLFVYYLISYLISAARMQWVSNYIDDIIDESLRREGLCGESKSRYSKDVYHYFTRIACHMRHDMWKHGVYVNDPRGKFNK